MIARLKKRVRVTILLLAKNIPGSPVNSLSGAGAQVKTLLLQNGLPNPLPYKSREIGAAEEWEGRGCPYEQAMALMDGDESAQLTALEIFERLGARPAVEKLKQQMRAEGIRGIPRGPRPRTRENPFGLTARELEVLAALVQGLSNNAIAKKLSLSTRTVEHHIASILQKMQVQSRNEAVALALKDNLLPSE